MEGAISNRDVARELFRKDSGDLSSLRFDLGQQTAQNDNLKEALDRVKHENEALQTQVQQLITNKQNLENQNATNLEKKLTQSVKDSSERCCHQESRNQGQ